MGISAFLTTIMTSLEAAIEALTEVGLRDKVIVIVGHPLVPAKYSAEIGADRCTQDAAADDIARKLLA